MAARLIETLPSGRDWLYELKLDGYRALLLKDGDRVRILSRNEKDLTRMYPSVVSASERLNAKQAVLDGEIVALDARGLPSFQALQHPSHKTRIVYYAFDILHLDGAKLTGRPLQQRRAQLPEVVNDSGILISEELPGIASQVIQAVRNLGLEGVIAKRRDSVYEPGRRSGAWVKLKLEQSQEFVIGGFQPESDRVGALLVGYYDGKQLHFAAKVRAGFVQHNRTTLFSKLKPLEVPRCPFVDLPTGRSRWGGGVSTEEMPLMHWVRPRLVAQIRFLEWTAEGRLRHAIFMGLRDDKRAKDVYRESA